MKKYTVEIYERIKPYGHVSYYPLGLYTIKAGNMKVAKSMAIDEAKVDNNNAKLYVNWNRVSAVVKHAVEAF